VMNERLNNQDPKIPIVKQVLNSKFKVPNDNYLIRDLKLKKETLDLIWKGMREACQTGGTGWPLFDFPIPVACKTGTAEFETLDKTHAWFTAFAPADKPEIAVTVLIENGGQGSDVAAPVAKKVMEKYFGMK
jgi:penicillin-binding protein 2